MGLAGADVEVRPEGLETLSQEIGNSKSQFDAAVDEINQQVLAMAGKALGADSDEYKAFVDRFEQQMKPKAEEISETLNAHSTKASRTAESGAEMIQKNINVING